MTSELGSSDAAVQDCSATQKAAYKKKNMMQMQNAVNRGRQ